MKAWEHYLIWGCIILLLSTHYRMLTGHFSNTCKEELFNSEGLGDLVFMEIGVFFSDESPKWMLVIMPDSKDWSKNRYFTGEHFLTVHQDSTLESINTHFAKDTCELKRMYIKNIEDRPSWPPRTGKMSKRLHEEEQ